jgi:epoxyqueuosine reductase
MNSISSLELTERIVEKAKLLGATIAGVASVNSLKESPSHRIYPKIGMNLKVHWQKAIDGSKPDDVAWPADAVSVVVIGVEHNIKQPEHDWWDGKGTPGNRILIRINKNLSEWIEDTFSIKTYKLPYFVSKGGIFLKDAAVMAGLGCLGRDNLVITPGYGPRIRFRALLMDREAEATGPLDFNPCEGCEEPCREACPVKSFKKPVYVADVLGQSILPGINGTYDRVICNRKMDKDIEDAVMAIPADDEEYIGVKQAIDDFEEGVTIKLKGDKPPNYYVKYCRKCELACPVGK